MPLDKLTWLSYADKRILIKHIKSQKCIGKQSYMCPDCNCSFLGSEKFERHIELKHGKGNYEDNSGKFKSKVWDHFLLDRKNYRAKCLTCLSIISVKGSSATPKVGPLHTHLRSKHSINCSQIK